MKPVEPVEPAVITQTKRFTTLTEKIENQTNGEVESTKILIDIKELAYIRQLKRGATKLVFTSGHSVMVLESPKEILAAANSPSYLYHDRDTDPQLP